MIAGIVDGEPQELAMHDYGSPFVAYFRMSNITILTASLVSCLRYEVLKREAAAPDQLAKQGDQQPRILKDLAS